MPYDPLETSPADITLDDLEIIAEQIRDGDESGTNVRDGYATSWSITIEKYKI